MKSELPAGEAKRASLLRGLTIAASAIALLSATALVTVSLPAAHAQDEAPAKAKGGGKGKGKAAEEPAIPPSQINQGPDIGGIYWIEEYNAKITPVGGGEPPYSDAGKKALAENQAKWKENRLENDLARKLCVPDGVPRILANPYPFEVVQTPNEVHFLYEINHAIRLISLDKKMPPDTELIALPWYLGHSIGHWEGDTLIIETKGYNDKTYLDNTGAPHSDQLSTVERVRKINATELEDVITITDPGVYTRPWQARFVYKLRNDVRIQDYNCGEKHRDLSSVKGVVVPK